jgi:hypothetical protein
MPPPATAPTVEELLQFARSREGVEFRTLDRNQPFQVSVDGEKLTIRTSTGTSRHPQLRRVKEVLAKLQSTGSMRPGDYSMESYNASYLLALAREWQSSHGQSHAGPVTLSVSKSLNPEELDRLRRAVSAAVRHRDCTINETRLSHGLEIQRRQYNARSTWIGSVYWSDNEPGNDVEIAFDPPRLANVSTEADGLDRWFRSTVDLMQNRPARNHSGDNPEWCRAGFTFVGALEFFARVASQTDPMLHEHKRWVMPPASNGEGAADAKAVSQPASEPEDQSIEHMLQMAKQACQRSGQTHATIEKTKAFLFDDDHSFRRHVAELIARQGNRCAITSLRLQFEGDCEDEDQLASLDRIDSNGHYAPGNLQVVCRFANRWKSDDTDQNFRRLVDLLRTDRS